MIQEATIQQYLIIEENVVTNIVLWNGDISTWTPPQGSIALVQANTPALVWEPVIVDNKLSDWVLGEQLGVGNIGFTWNGTVCTTNEPKPEIPVQPTTTGTETA